MHCWPTARHLPHVSARPTGRFYPRWHEYELQQTERLQYRLDEEQLRHDWLQLLSLGKPGMPLEQLHVWTLAHIVRRPVIVYGVKYVKSFRGEPLGYARFEGQCRHSFSSSLSFIL